MNIAILLTVIAAASSIVGGLFGIIKEKPSNQLIAFSLGFAAGIMLMIALTEMLPPILNLDGFGAIWGCIAFGMGLISFYLIDYCLPHQHPLDVHSRQSNPSLSSPEDLCLIDPTKINRATLLLVLGITLHNFPEGIATFITTTQDVSLGIGITLAIVIHNFPEGLVVSSAVYLATQSRIKAIFAAMIASFAELLGGIVAYFLISTETSIVHLDYAMAFVAGIMVSLSIDELLPLSKQLAPNTNPSVGIFTGMITMVLSLSLLKIVL